MTENTSQKTPAISCHLAKMVLQVMWKCCHVIMETYTISEAESLLYPVKWSHALKFSISENNFITMNWFPLQMQFFTNTSNLQWTILHLFEKLGNLFKLQNFIMDWSSFLEHILYTNTNCKTDLRDHSLCPTKPEGTWVSYKMQENITFSLFRVQCN